MFVDPDRHYVWAVVNAGFVFYDGYKAYKVGKKAGKKGWAIAGSVAWAAGSSFVKVGHLKKVVKALGASKKSATHKHHAFPKYLGGILSNRL